MNQVGETVTRVMEEAVGVAEEILAVRPASGGKPPVHYGNIWLSRTQKRDRWRTMQFIKRANKAVVVFHEQPMDKWKRHVASAKLLRLFRWARGRGFSSAGLPDTFGDKERGEGEDMV
jgi:hypothetical protein